MFDNFSSHKFNIYKNKLYLPIYETGLIIIYDIKMNNIIYFNTNLKNLYS